MKKSKTNEYQYLFGPVPSRRLGRSLGVDLTALKTCNFDCVFCQLGRTQHKISKRDTYAPVDAVIAELKDWLVTDGHADYITLSGSGEPTLHLGFGEVLSFLKKSTLPSVLLTNGSLLKDPKVRKDAALADVVKVSLSAWDRHSFEWINRPHNELSFNRLVEGQKAFRKEFTGQLWMEVFLLFGMNDRPAGVTRIATVAKTINPDRIQLNTVVRPPAEEFAGALSPARMQALCPLFEPPAEVIADFHVPHTDSIQVTSATILSMLQRRPCTISQIASVFNLHINEVSKHLGALISGDAIVTVREKSEMYYSVVCKTVEPIPVR